MTLRTSGTQPLLRRRKTVVAAAACPNPSPVARARVSFAGTENRRAVSGADSQRSSVQPVADTAAPPR